MDVEARIDQHRQSGAFVEKLENLEIERVFACLDYLRAR